MRIEDIALRVLVATLCGILIGFDRAKKGRNAGAKTHALVSLGAALAVIVGEGFYEKLGGGFDLIRIAAQVVAGIGFLGAGAIIVTSNQKVVGLTTAATLWLSSIIGIVAGAGLYWATLFGMMGWFLTFTIVEIIDKRVSKYAPTAVAFVKLKSPLSKLDLMEFFHKSNCEILDMIDVTTPVEVAEDETHIKVSIGLNYGMPIKKLEETLSSIPGIKYVSVLKD